MKICNKATRKQGRIQIQKQKKAGEEKRRAQMKAHLTSLGGPKGPESGCDFRCTVSELGKETTRTLGYVVRLFKEPTTMTTGQFTFTKSLQRKPPPFHFYFCNETKRFERRFTEAQKEDERTQAKTSSRMPSSTDLDSADDDGKAVPLVVLRIMKLRLDLVRSFSLQHYADEKIKQVFDYGKDIHTYSWQNGEKVRVSRFLQGSNKFLD